MTFHKKPLDTRPARTDLTDRECSKIIGGVIGTLCQMAPAENVRAAVAWWAETDDAWSALDQLTEIAMAEAKARGLAR